MPLSKSATFIAVGVAFLAGIIGSLAIRPTGNTTALSSNSKPYQQNVQVHWRVPLAFNTNLPSLGDTMLYVAETLKTASNGTILFELHEPGAIVPPFSITEAVRDHKVPAGYTWLGYDQGHLPVSPLLSAVPFGMSPWEFMAWWYNVGGQELATDIYRNQGLRPVLCGLIGPETAGWFRKPIQSLADLQGLKIRFAGLGGKVLQKLGASITIIPGGEIFQALEKGAIDATEYSLPAIDRKLGFDRLAQYNYFPGWHQTFTAFHLVVNLRVWEGLTHSERQLIETTCTAGVSRSLASAEALQGEALEYLQQVGVTTASLPTVLLKELQATTLEIMTGEAAKDAEFARVYAHQQKFRAQYQRWQRLAYLPADF